ncbi:MAG TPA: ArsA-related P-loop ATPase [Candidatus Binataceae bacterium]|nr:ArsA-related P-loop ATPase [Candidatus Binataceae bacterium]
MTLPRLIFVTGKGGTGKSTLAGALALALSRRHKTVIADLDQRMTTARLLGVELNGSRRASLGPLLDALALTARAELESFIERIVPIKAIARRMLNSHTFGYVTAALPGLEAFLMLERLRLLSAEAAEHEGFVVVDGPATGGAIELLSTASGVMNLAPSGTLNRLAKTVDEFLRDPRQFGALVTLKPEELALREAIEAASLLRDKIGVGYVAAILNGVPESLFSTAEIARIRRLSGARRLAMRRQATSKFAEQACERLHAEGLEVVELPMLFSSAFGRSELETLGAELNHAGWN